VGQVLSQFECPLAYTLWDSSAQMDWRYRMRREGQEYRPLMWFIYDHDNGGDLWQWPKRETTPTFFLWKTSQCARDILRYKLIYVKHNYFNVYEATCFDLFKRSSSGLLADRVLCNWLHRSYAFYHCKHIGIPTCTQHLLTRSARRPDDDRLKRSKHVVSYTLK